ncbi:MAG: branched-chain amino acid ABC transporter permease [Oscillospiraceae bacterium]|nr:branched-chain amino acid ABC transporter permease [Oscillospiraceae bacterium]
MTVFLLVLINGCIVGSTYALMAMGMSTQYGVARILNIAHGEFIVLAAVVTYALQQSGLGLHPLFALVLACPIVFAISYILHITLYRRLRRLSPNLGVFEGNAILVSFGIYYIAQNLLQTYMGAAPKRYPFMMTSVNIGGAGISAAGLFVMLIAIVICVLYTIFLSRTRLGKSIRAASQDSQAAAHLGVKINSIMALCFAIGGILAACAGVLMSMREQFQSTSGLGYTTIAIIIVVLGGLGSVKGAILGGFILGIVGYTVSHFIDSVFMISVFYMIILVLLIVRPKGLLGR